MFVNMFRRSCSSADQLAGTCKGGMRAEAGKCYVGQHRRARQVVARTSRWR